MIIRGVKIIWLYIGLLLDGFWIGSKLTSVFDTIGYETYDSETADMLADIIRYISVFLAAIFIGIGIVW